MILEILTIPLRPDADIEKPTSSAHDIIHKFCVQTLTSEGARYAYFGRSVEQPTTVLIFIGWDKIEHSHQSTSTPTDPFAALRAIAADIAVLHIPFESSKDPVSALGADKRVGVTELVLYYFHSPLTNKDAIMESIDKMRPVMARSEACGAFDEWVLDDLNNEKGGESEKGEGKKKGEESERGQETEKGEEKKEGERSTVWVNLVGWTDIDAHMRFQASEDFKANVHWVTEIEGLKGMAMHHVKLERV